MSQLKQNIFIHKITNYGSPKTENLLTLILLQTCMSFFLLLKTKEDILKDVGNQTVNIVAIDFHSMFLLMWKSMATVNWLTTFFKIFSFVFNRRKKLIQVWSNLRVSKI